MTSVSERALIDRINRRMGEHECVRVCDERSRSFHDLGRYYALDLYRNTIIASHLDLEKFGREIGALNPGESLAD